MSSSENDSNSLKLISTKDTVRKIVDMIQHKKGGIYLRYGDGDFNILLGHNDMLAVCTSDFQYWIKKSMIMNNDYVLISIPHHCPEKGTVEPGMCPGNHENPLPVVQRFIDTLTEYQHHVPSIIYTSVAICYCASHHPDIIIEMHKEIKKHRALFIGNQNYSNEYLIKLFGTSLQRINTPSRDSYMEHDRIFSEFDTLYQQLFGSLDFFVIIMAAGCGGRAFTAELYHKYPSRNFFILDYGSLLDYMWGENSRAYMEIDPPNAEYILNSI
jgi:hypothetical protein